jgi:hypothetical protein
VLSLAFVSVVLARGAALTVHIDLPAHAVRPLLYGAALA